MADTSEIEGERRLLGHRDLADVRKPASVLRDRTGARCAHRSSRRCLYGSATCGRARQTAPSGNEGEAEAQRGERIQDGRKRQAEPALLLRTERSDLRGEVRGGVALAKPEERFGPAPFSFLTQSPSPLLTHEAVDQGTTFTFTMPIASNAAW